MPTKVGEEPEKIIKIGTNAQVIPALSTYLPLSIRLFKTGSDSNQAPRHVGMPPLKHFLSSLKA